MLASRIRLALDLLEDHAAGRCSQIPYHTVAVLAAAVFYYVDPVDVVPDIIPKVGTSDDGIMLELAFRLAAPGIDRYRAWKGAGGIKRRATPATRQRRPAKRSSSRRRRP